MDNNKINSKDQRRQEAILARLEGVAAAERRHQQRVLGSIAAGLLCVAVTALLVFGSRQTRLESPQVAEIPTQSPVDIHLPSEPADVLPATPQSEARPNSNPNPTQTQPPTLLAQTHTPDRPKDDAPKPQESATMEPQPMAATPASAPIQYKHVEVLANPQPIVIETDRLVYTDTPAPRDPLLFDTEPMRNYIREQIRLETQSLASL